jgi:hypothetical protein
MSQHPLDRFRPPQAPPELRQRTLTAARAALRETHQPPQGLAFWIDQLWQSRTLRLAWTAAVFLLLAVNVLITVAPPHPAQDGGTTTFAARSSRSDDPLFLADIAPAGLGTATGNAPTWGESWTQQRTLEPHLPLQETF